MIPLKKAFKTEIILTDDQKILANKTIGVCRYVANMYIAKEKEHYEKTGKFLSGMDFHKWFNNEYKPNHDPWLKEVHQKPIKQAIMNVDAAFRQFFKGEAGYPKFKKKKDENVKAYFPKNNPRDFRVQRHKMKMPSLGWIRLKEYGYIPVGADISSCTISKKAGRYYVSVLCEVEEPNEIQTPEHDGIGIDLGIKDFAVCSHHQTFQNINKTQRVKALEKQLRRAQRSLSRSYQLNKKKDEDGKYIHYSNRQKKILRIQQLHVRLANIRKEYTRDVANQLVKTKPTYITIEDLNIRGMMKNKHLSKAVANQNFYGFRTYLKNKCMEYGIELRAVSKSYPSSKTCSVCGGKKKKLKLSERIFKCNHCDTELDRDFNASLNLKHATEYTVLT